MAVKQMPMTHITSKELASLTNEVHLLRRLDHPNIVRYIAADASEGLLKIFLEYIPGGSIKSLLEKFGSLEESVMSNYTRQLLLVCAIIAYRVEYHCMRSQALCVFI